MVSGGNGNERVGIRSLRSCGTRSTARPASRQKPLTREHASTTLVPLSPRPGVIRRARLQSSTPRCAASSGPGRPSSEHRARSASPWRDAKRARSRDGPRRSPRSTHVCTLHAFSPATTARRGSRPSCGSTIPTARRRDRLLSSSAARCAGRPKRACRRRAAAAGRSTSRSSRARRTRARSVTTSPCRASPAVAARSWCWASPTAAVSSFTSSTGCRLIA